MKEPASVAIDRIPIARRSWRVEWLGAAALVSTLIWGAASLGAAPAPGAAERLSPEDAEFFEKRVRPLLVEQCVGCHGSRGVPQAGLRLDTRALALKGGHRGPTLVAGDPRRSLLIRAIRYEEQELRMPPKGKMTGEQIDTLVEWVRRGAPWPGAAAPSPTPGNTAGAGIWGTMKTHWAFQPIRPQRPPKVKNPGWVQSPIDAFLLARLERAGLRPAPPADRQTLIRRLSYDLLGLPPTPEEVEAFVADRSPDAWRKLVDRTLASPHYGERSARLWLDLVRYAETDGHEFDFDKVNPWVYRDYVIKAFNQDVPYDRFVLEHLAGDLLPEPRRDPGDRSNQSLIGTTFLWLGEGKHSPVDLRVDEEERVDNQIDVIGKTFFGLSMGCARCHDHKFDPVGSKDYYAFFSYMRSTRYQLEPIDDPEPVRRTAAEIRRLNEQLRPMLLAANGLDEARTAGTPARTAQRLLLAGLQEPAPQAAAAEVFEAFSRPDYAGWFTSGEAFSAGPNAAPRPDFEPATGRLKALVPAGAADSGAISARLEGALRSPNFTIRTPFIHILMGGVDCKVNLVIDNFQRIRNPLYGGLTLPISGPLAWQTFHLGKFQGHRAYLEFLDHGPGWLAVDEVRFSEGRAPANPPGSVAGSPAVSVSPELRRLLDQRVRLEQSIPPVTRVMTAGDGSPETEYVHLRGNYRTPGEPAPRRNLRLFGGQPPAAPDRGSGRLDLARQLVSPANPLVARVMANRIWRQHFGEGIVRTPDDFGTRGEEPTHPELLDYLATEVMRGGWSIKKMHRLLLNSSAYRMSSRADPAQQARAERVDAANMLLHRMPVRRLDAESIRDGILAVSGRLDRKMFGPSVMPYLTPYMEGRGRPGRSGPLDGEGRRSVYLGVRRNFLNPMFLAFDFPVPFNSMGRRSVSTVPAQALTMMNNPFVTQQAKLWGERILSAELPDDRARVQRMHLQAFGRPASAQELEPSLAFLASRAGSAEERTRAWADLAHVLLNTKEFIFLP